jgi:hypothetical protein
MRDMCDAFYDSSDRKMFIVFHPNVGLSLECLEGEVK